jgi:glutamate racemase
MQAGSQLLPSPLVGEGARRADEGYPKSPFTPHPQSHTMDSMKKTEAEKPIGIFDSGVGGLTVAHAVRKSLPNENLIYFGDTAHLPYGDKSTAAIQAYSVKIAHMLLQQDCKLILIACNSASAAAYELVKEYVQSRAMVMNVIDPTIRFIHEAYAGKSIGLIGTRQTVNSCIYKKKFDELNSNIKLSSVPTNLLASAIEEFGNHHVLDALLETYLAHPDLQQIDALLLACTHYPVIKKHFQHYYQHKIDIIDSSLVVAEAVKTTLDKFNLRNTADNSTARFYVSDYTETFAQNARLFFGDRITLEHYPLWD